MESSPETRRLCRCRCGALGPHEPHGYICTTTCRRRPRSGSRASRTRVSLSRSQEFRALNEATAAYRKVASELKLEQYLVPLNLVEQRELFLGIAEKGVRTNPSFIYESPPIDAENQLRDIRTSLRAHNRSYWSRLLETTLDSDLNLLKALATHSGDAITRTSTELYDGPSDAIVSDARLALASPEARQPEAADVPARELVTAFRRALSFLRLSHWRVELSDRIIARVSVSPAERVLRVAHGAVFTHHDVGRLLVHEIGTHVIRAANGEQQPLSLLGLGVGRYLETEEGLAAYQELEAGFQNVATRRLHALRVVAVNESLSGSFYDSFAAVRPHLEPQAAFATVVRAKRGIADTAEAGAYTKDVVYFRGLTRVSTHLHDEPGDLGLLISGKLGLEMLSQAAALRADGLLREPEYLPETLVDALPDLVS